MRRDLAAAVAHVSEGRSFVPSASVLPQWHRADGHRHDLLPYASDALLIDAVMGFFDSALDAGNSLVAIVSASHRQALDEQFTRRGVDVAALAAAGRYAAADSLAALESIMVYGMPDGDLFAARMDSIVRHGLSAARTSNPHVTLFGEIAPILCARGEYDAMIRLEQIAGEYTQSRPVSILCGYTTACLDDSRLHARICAQHSTIISASPTR
jgi:hypothetical protein